MIALRSCIRFAYANLKFGLDLGLLQTRILRQPENGCSPNFRLLCGQMA
ncbi:hypothetical protein GCWU000324_02553 [Kingella oralis ATCC 51147]|uniref:Uncharacterized protein n=1 Tax=Kingella oralis ATCC 51147 TaxID=629741 RepID=C4GLI2_9NEIS|nr:hypothetical protein GCWU000324_02553 [Kingella oralis ATCC 51147]